MTPIILMSGQARAGKDTAAAVFAEVLGGQCIALSDPMKRFLMDAYGMTEDQLWGDQKEVEFEPRRVKDYGLDGSLSEALGDGYLESTYGDEMVMELIGALATWGKKLPKKTTPRHMLQTLGTECIREIDPDFWIDYGLHVADNLLLGDMGYSRIGGLVERDLVDSPDVPMNAVVITDGRFRNEILPVKKAGGLCYRVKRSEPLKKDEIKFKVSKAPEWKQHASETEQQSMPDWWFDGVLRNEGTLEEFIARAQALAYRIRAPIFHPALVASTPD